MSNSKCGGLIHQILAGSAASFGVLASATVFAWITPTLPHLLGQNSEIPMTSEEASWMVSMPEFGNLVSPLPAGYIADHFGRKVAILISAPILFIGWIIVLYFKTLLTLNIARAIQGVAIGIVYTVVPMYLGEIANPKYRGVVTSLFYCLWWFGFLVEYTLGPAMSFVNFTYMSALPSLIFFIIFLWQPESPYYYLMKNDIRNAKKSLEWLLNTSEEEISTELESMRHCIEEDQTKKVLWNELFATSKDRKALLILFFVGFLRQFCGIIPLSLYSTQTLRAAGDNFFVSPDTVTLIMGVMMLIGSLCSSFTLDICGRRSLLFLSCTVSGVSMLSAGTFYFLKSQSFVDASVFSWIPPMALIILSGVSVVGIFPVNIAYASELFTSNTRGLASSVFSIYTTCIGIVVIKFFLTISNYYGLFVNFYIFAVVNFIGTLSSFFVMPETKGKSFQQIRNEL